MSVIEFPLINYNDVPSVLRALADQIENGDYGTALGFVYAFNYICNVDSYIHLSVNSYFNIYCFHFENINCCQQYIANSGADVPPFSNALLFSFCACGEQLCK